MCSASRNCAILFVLLSILPTLSKAEERVLRVRAWIPRGSEDTTGRRVAVDLELDAQLAKAG